MNKFSKEDLMTGDIILFRNNVKGIYIERIKSFSNYCSIICPNNKTIDYEKIDYLLCHVNYPEWDIMKIFRARTVDEISFNLDKYNEDDIIFIRNKNTKKDNATKIYSNGKTAEENHRILWNLLADHPDWNKYEAIEQMGFDVDNEEIKLNCFACDVVNGECDICPITVDANKECVDGLFQKYCDASGYEKARIAKEIAYIPWNKK